MLFLISLCFIMVPLRCVFGIILIINVLLFCAKIICVELFYTLLNL